MFASVKEQHAICKGGAIRLRKSSLDKKHDHRISKSQEMSWNGKNEETFQKPEEKKTPTHNSEMGGWREGTQSVETQLGGSYITFGIPERDKGGESIFFVFFLIYFY